MTAYVQFILQIMSSSNQFILMSLHHCFQPKPIMNPLGLKQTNNLPKHFTCKHIPTGCQETSRNSADYSNANPGRTLRFSGDHLPPQGRTLSYHQQQPRSDAVQSAIKNQENLEENKKEGNFYQLNLSYSKHNKINAEEPSIINISPKSIKNHFEPQSIIPSRAQQCKKEAKHHIQKTVDFHAKVPRFLKANSLPEEQRSLFNIPLNDNQENNFRQPKTERDMINQKQNHSMALIPENLNLRKHISERDDKQVHRQRKEELKGLQNPYARFILQSKIQKTVEFQPKNYKINRSNHPAKTWFKQNAPLEQTQTTLPLFQQFSTAQKQQKESNKKNITCQLKKKSNFQFFKNIKKKKLTCVFHQPQRQFELNDFSLLDKLGKGSFGDVFLAQQKASGFLCVIKKISKKKVKDNKMQQHLLREIKIQSYLDHRHLTSLYGFFDDESNIYLILQLLPDGSLAQGKSKRKVPQNEVSKYIYQISLGLKHMHTQNVIHRDIKPQNIFLCGNYAKIGDFGCSIHTNTSRNSQIGSLAYISPEQLKLQNYNEKIDVWSLGVIAYEMLLGFSPFQSQIIKIARKEMSPQLFELTFPQKMDLSSEAKDFLMGLLNNNPQSRFLIKEALKHQFIVKHNKYEDIKLQKHLN